jgi:periplasmic protein CpxP/Spy
MKRALLTSAVLIAGLGLALPVFAQPDRALGMGGPGPDRHFGRMCEDQDAHLAGKLAFAEKKLRITDAQRPAWTKFADAARASLKPTQDLCAKFKDQPMPTALPQRLERMETMMQTHLQQLQGVRPALTDLYAQLTPEQQKTADSLLPHRGGPGMGGMGGGMGHGPRHDGERGPRVGGPADKPQDVK